MSHCFFRSTGFSIIIVSLVGCFGGSDIAPPPAIRPSEAGAEAMRLYDANGDGAVAGDEFVKAPGLKAALKRLDQDGDGRVTADEVASRVETWQANKLGSIPVSVQVYLDNQPLPGAVITFEPEPFLGAQIQAGTGKTRDGGTAFVSIPREKRASPNSPAGMYFGLYKVRISKMVGQTEKIPSKYNTQTTLGQEIAFDDPNLQRGIVFQLKSR
ncbi:MAG: hypothetical protein JW829_03815 [Pirellulales bacterium]|nr:hypothetical protein [Pirellulales bacterium]